jgi:hypothetical protein
VGEPQFVDGQVVGTLENGVFEQVIYSAHIYRRFQAKGMDVHLHQALQGKCRLWRLRFGDTGQVISIPFERIEQAGFIFSPGKGSGRQIMVKLKLFDEETPVMQRRMI